MGALNAPSALKKLEVRKVKLSSLQAVVICIIHGVAVWLDDHGELMGAPCGVPLSDIGRLWIKTHRDEIIDGLKPEYEAACFEVLRAGYTADVDAEARGIFEALHQNNPHMSPQECRHRAWAEVLGADGVDVVWTKN